MSYLDKYKGYGDSKSVYDILSLNPNNKTHWENEIKPKYVATDIEKVVGELSEVNECCAVQGYDDDEKPIVRLYIVLAPDADADKLDEYKQIIMDKCSTLDTFSIPRDIKVIDALPRTRLEKVDFLKLTQTRTESSKT